RVRPRIYVFGDEPCGVREGLLYRPVVSAVFQSLPLPRERKVELALGADTLDCGVYPIVQGLPEIVDRIPDDGPKMLWDVLFGPVGQCKAIRFSEERMTPVRPVRDFIQIVGHNGR